MLRPDMLYVASRAYKVAGRMKDKVTTEKRQETDDAILT